MHEDPCYESIPRDDSSGPNHLFPWLYWWGSFLPFVTQANFISLVARLDPMWRCTGVFEKFLDEADFLPILATVLTGRIIPPCFVIEVSAVNPFDQEQIFLWCNCPYLFCNQGFIPSCKVFYSQPTVLFLWADRLPCHFGGCEESCSPPPKGDFCISG